VIEAVIFDWGGTLTRWHDIDFHAEALALAKAVVAVGEPDHHADRLRAAGEAIWVRSRDEHRSATIADVFAGAGLEHDPALLDAYHAFWDPHTVTDPAVGPLWEALHTDGTRVGVLSNTLWSRDRHRGIFARDRVDHLLDGDVYTSEIPWTKPHERAFRAAMDAVGVADPARCVYVGDRLFDDVWGAQRAGLRTIHIPHSTIPARQRGHAEGVPDAVADSLDEVLTIVREWR
jgi:putative hydrolase of the HAD superfamily